MQDSDRSQENAGASVGYEAGPLNEQSLLPANRGSGDAPTVSVIIPVYNGGEAFRLCLEAIRAADPPPDELIVVADGDTDGSRTAAERFGARTVCLPSPRGPATARNIGAGLAGGDILFFLDADVTIPRSLVGQASRALQDDLEISAVIGSYDDSPSETNFLSQYKNLLHHYVHQQGKSEASTFWGACGAIRREAFWSVGGFDEAYRRPSVEDIDLGYRLKKQGHRILLLKELRVKHLKHWNALSLLKTDFFRRALPWTYLIQRDRIALNDLNLTLPNRISVITVYLISATLMAGIYVPWLWFSAGPLMLVLLTFNFRLYRFFSKKHRLWFAARAILWHWFSFLYGGLAFFFGLITYWMRRRK